MNTSRGGDDRNQSLAVVIVDHDQTDQVRAQLAAYLAEDPALFAATRWIVIRNGEDRRTTWSVTSGDERSAYSAVEVIACENRGYGSAINRGAAVAGCRYVLASNADLLPQPGFLAAVYRLIAEMDDPAGPWNTVGIVGFRLLNEDLSEQGSVGRFPTLCRTLLGLMRRRAVRKYISVRATEPVDAAWVTGACMLVSQRLLESAGGFDEQFFMYYEDVDLCRRAWKEGFRVLYDPRSAVRHLFPYHGRPLSHQMVSLARRSMLLYIHRHRPWWEFWLLGRIVLWDCALRTWRAAKSERPSWRSVTGEIVALLRDLRNSRPASADRPWHVSNAARSGDG